MKLLVLFVSLLCCVSVYAQDYEGEYSKYKVYKNLKKATRDKEEVVVLNLTGKGLEKIPVEIFELSNLKILNLYNNNIKIVPKEIYKLQSLEILNLMRNNLDELPTEIMNLRGLKKLNVSQNKLFEKDVVFIKERLPDCLVIVDIVL